MSELHKEPQAIGQSAMVVDELVENDLVVPHLKCCPFRLVRLFEIVIESEVGVLGIIAQEFRSFFLVTNFVRLALVETDQEL